MHRLMCFIVVNRFCHDVAHNSKGFVDSRLVWMILKGNDEETWQKVKLIYVGNAGRLGQKIYMCVSGFSSEKKRYGWSALNINVYFILIFYMYIWLLSHIFPTFSIIFDYTLLILHNKMLRVSAKT